MKRSKNILPHYQEKQKILHAANPSKEILLQTGEIYVEASQLNDAVDCYEVAQARDKLESLLSTSVSAGDVFLFQRINRILGREPSGEEWNTLGSAALESGKWAFAREAFLKSGNEVMAEKVKIKQKEAGLLEPAPSPGEISTEEEPKKK